ncbi:MAG: hypothetical protein HY720_21945 [Planctomycetes bacterium]|nr:hypothetical protein [Planctomycetota bacterium]
MTAEELKKIVFGKPFRAVRITLHAGDPIVVRHPECIAMSGSWVSVIPEPGPPIFFEVHQVVSVQYLKNGRARR